MQYRNGFNFTWSNGRQLTGITNSSNNISYVYNADGLRSSKTVNGTTTDYYWLEGILIGQKTGNDYIIYLYDESGTPYGIIYNDTYYYLFDAQGNVVGIINADGNLLARYFYDAWGNTISIVSDSGTIINPGMNHIANINPLRYRGYYYDVETGFYYLQSRYYDSVTGRFVNADGLISTGQGVLGYNMFAYCANNPVNFVDPTGFSFVSFVKEIFDKIRTMIVKMLTPKSVSKQGLEFIATYEGGFSSVPYDDGLGNPTIGYGHCIQPGETFTEITEQEGLELFKVDINSKEKFVRDYMISKNIYWNQHQFDAMVSVAYNTTPNGFYNVADKIVAGWDVESAFTWRYTRENAKTLGGTELGLWRRRMDECDIFLYGTYIREDRKP